jgi:lysophospholipase L1-like esterase
MVGYVKWAEFTENNVISQLDENEFMQSIFAKKEFLELMNIVLKDQNKTFSTIQDFDNSVALSKELFNSQEMFGYTKYVYKPNIGVYNLRIWTGLRGKRMVLAETPEIRAALAKNKIFTEVYFKTDSFGFKQTEFAWSTNSFTIFFLGDSFTEGLWAKPEETFVNQLGQKLKNKFPSIDPINLGVDGYSALEEDWMLENYAPLLNPKLAVVNLFPNDVHVNYIKVLQGVDIPDSNYTEMFHYLKRMKDFCEKKKITFVISVIPAREQFNELAGFTIFPDKVKHWCNDNGVIELDPRSYFEKIGIDRIYFSWDPHFSPFGHKVYSEFLKQNLNSILMSIS